MITSLPGTTVRHVDVAGVRFLVRTAGPARQRRTTPVLLLHGVPQTSAAWRHLIPELARDRSVFAPDLKGLGGSEVVGPYDVPTLVAELVALVEELCDGPVDVVGHDWGGSLAIGVAAARPDLVRRLVVVNAPYRRLDVLHAAHIPFYALPVVPDLLGDLAAGRVVRAMLRLGWKAPTPLDEDVVEEYVEAYEPPSRWRAMLAYYRGVARPQVARLARGLLPLGRAGGPDGQADAPGPAIPVERKLVVWGALDPALPLWVGEAAARDLGSDTVLVTVPGAGHFVVEEAPEVVVPVIAGFLRDGDDAAPKPPSGGDGAGRRAAGRGQARGQGEGGAAGHQPL